MTSVLADLQKEVEEIVRLLVNGEYSRLVEITRGVRLSRAEIDDAISSYGRELVMPPQGAYQYMDAIEIAGVMPKTWSIVMPLWTREEGRSDLSVELTIAPHEGRARIELDDIRVR